MKHPPHHAHAQSIRYLLCLLLACLLTACGKRETASGTATTVEVWAHAGQQSERKVLESQVDRFNAHNPDLRLHLTLIPEGSYNARVQAAAVAGGLPDLLEFDGPFLYAYVWQGRLQPLDDLIPSRILDDLLPSIIEQGTYRHRLWSVGCFDSGLGLYVRPPTAAGWPRPAFASPA